MSVRLREAPTALVLDEDAVTGLGSVALTAAGELILVVGPEGGISPDELAEFADAGAAASGWVNRCCGPRPPAGRPWRR